MSKGKKILIGVLIALALILIIGVAFAATLLSRINYRSLDELAEEAAQSSPTVTASPVATVEESPLASPTGSPEPKESEAPEEEEEDIVIADEIQQSELSEEEQAAMEHEQGNEVVNVLLVGVDRRSGDGNSRSDSIMIATLDQPNQRLKLTSLMRDMYVSIPGRSDNRINRSAAEGGIPLLIDTINENFQMDLEYYVMVDFYMFEKVIDELGGITINMSRGEVSEANDCIAGLNKQRGHKTRDGLITQKSGGDVTLTGKQALGYARMRHFGGGDYSRTSRQAKVLQAVLNKFIAAGAVRQTQVMYDLMPLIETNLSATQIVSLAGKVLGVDEKGIMHYRLPVEGTYKQRTIRGMWVLVPDLPANAKQLHWFLYDATEIDPLPQSDTSSGSYYSKGSRATEETTPDAEETPLAEEAPLDEGTPPAEGSPPPEGVPGEESSPPAEGKTEEAAPNGNSPSASPADNSTPQSSPTANATSGEAKSANPKETQSSSKEPQLLPRAQSTETPDAEESAQGTETKGENGENEG